MPSDYVLKYLSPSRCCLIGCFEKEEAAGLGLQRFPALRESHVPRPLSRDRRQLRMPRRCALQFPHVIVGYAEASRSFLEFVFDVSCLVFDGNAIKPFQNASF